MSNNNNNTTQFLRPNAAEVDATTTPAREVSRVFSTQGHEFDSPEDFVAFHESTSSLASALRMAEGEAAVDKIIKDLEESKSWFTMENVGVALGSLALAAGAVYGGVLLYRKFNPGENASGLFDGTALTASFGDCGEALVPSAY